MSLNEQKLNALTRLRECKQPISLLDLLVILGKDYSERTLRRWLSEWNTSGIVIKLGNKRSTKYLAAENVKETPLNQAVFDAESQRSIQKIKQPYSLRTPISYKPHWLQQYQPNKDSWFGLALQEKLHQVGVRAKNHEPAGTYARQIYQRLLIDLSYNSSRLEGNTHSLLETEQLIIEGIDAPGKLDEEKTMILNHKEAIRYLVNTTSEIKIKDTTLLTLHYLLADSLVSPQYAGKVRDYGVRIGGSVYIPLENPQELKKYLHLICEKAAQIHNPYEQSIFLLAHVAYLQAFVDVNKRTSRLAANIPLINHNLVPLSFNDVNQQDYTDAMIALYELNDPRPLVNLYQFSYLRTAAMYDATIESLGFDRIRVLYRQQRRNLIRHIVIHKLRDKAMLDFIATTVEQFAKPEDKESVIRNIHEDLTELGPQSIAGLGITGDELQAWYNERKG